MGESIHLLPMKTLTKPIFEFEINTPPAMNEIIKEARGNVYASNKTKQEWTTRVALECRDFPPISYPVVFQLDFYLSNRRRDPDNLSASKKFILDGIVAAGVLPSDNFNWVKGFIELYHHEKGSDYVVVQCYKWEGE